MTIYIAGQSNGGYISRGDIYQTYNTDIFASDLVSTDRYVAGGTPLHANETGMDWYPVEDGDENTGELYDDFLATATDVTGIVWVQGEADKNQPERALAYESNLQALIEGFVGAFGDIPIVVVALSTHAPVSYESRFVETWQMIREAQLQVDQKFANVTVIDPDVIAAVHGVTPEEMFGDAFIHYSVPFADLLMAEALGSTFPERDAATHGTAQDDVLIGSNATDHVDGSHGDDYINGGQGDDYLYGGHGKDHLIGNLGDDVLRGSYGCDKVTGQAGNDILIGDGTGNPEVFTEDCNDILLGNLGDDILIGGPGDDLLAGGADADTFIFAPGDGHDILAKERNGALLRDFTKGDRLDFTAFEDTPIMLEANGNDLLVSAGDVSVSLIGVSLSEVMVENGSLYQTDAGPIPAPANSALFGSDADDSLRGSNMSDHLEGGSGDDILNGANGDDVLFGCDGSDYLIGNDGSDVLIGGLGSDIVTGQDGNDILYGDDPDILQSGSASCDDVLKGNLGDDILIGGIGDDVLAGGAGADVFVFRPGDGNDTVAMERNGEMQRDFGIGDLLDFTAFSGSALEIVETTHGLALSIEDVTVLLVGVSAEELNYAL